MTAEPATYPGHRFPTEIISHAVWLYHVFSLSLRDMELILAERGVAITHESIRQRRHLMTAAQYPRTRAKAFRVWRQETCAQIAE